MSSEAGGVLVGSMLRVNAAGWSAWYGNANPAAANAVPEPASLGIAALAMLAVVTVTGPLFPRQPPIRPRR